MTYWRSKAQLRPRELAVISSQSLRTIQRKIRSGLIVSRLDGGARVIPIAECLRFVGEEPHGESDGARLAGEDVLEAISKVRTRIAKGAR